MNSDIDHIVLTRFNLPSSGSESLVRAKEGWLRQRVELFERYCMPSVAAQGVKDFHWIIYFDPESPEWLMTRISEWCSDGAFTPIFRESVGHAELVGDLRAVSGARRPRLITTNLDNDDGLATDFIERLQKAPVSSPRAALYLSRGLIKRDGRVYLRTDRDNAFCSVAEDWTEPAGCWADWHNRLALQMPVIEIGGAPGWLQVIHGLNVSNRVRGRQVAPTDYRQLFGSSLDDVFAPNAGQLAMDALWNAPHRIIKETGRAAVKRAVLRLAGEDGLDRLKAGLVVRR